MITEEIGDESEWLTNIDLLKSFESYQDDMEFFEKFLKVRRENKKRFINWLKKKVKFDDIDDKQYINTLFDFVPKRVDENKRQLMCLVYVVYRYFSIKKLSDKSKVIESIQILLIRIIDSVKVHIHRRQDCS